MARATIKITDEERNGHRGYRVSIEYDPPVKDGKSESFAQHMGAKVMEALQMQASVQGQLVETVPREERKTVWERLFG